MKTFDSEASQRLKMARDARGLSQNDMVIRSDMPLNNYQRYEYGGSQPMYDRARAMCDALDISMDWLYGSPRRCETNWEDGETFSEILYYLRHTVAHMNQKTFANAVGVSPRSIDLAENYCNVSMTTVIKIADFFDMPIDYITGRGAKKGINE